MTPLLPFLPLCMPEVGDEIILASPRVAEPRVGIFNIRNDQDSRATLQLVTNDGTFWPIDPRSEYWCAYRPEDLPLAGLKLDLLRSLGAP